MGLLVDYFSAPSDTEAEAVIEEGPRGTESRSGQGFLVVDGLGVEPVVELSQLEASLTGRRWESILEDEDSYQILGDLGGGEVLVIRLGDAFESALLAVDDEDVAQVATSWADIEEFAGMRDSSELTVLVGELKQLASRAREDGEHVYAWVSV